MSDVLEEASGIAEIRDLDLLLPIVAELMAWRVEHPGPPLCTHCQASFEAHALQVYARYPHLDTRWVRTRLRELFEASRRRRGVSRK